MTGGKGMETRVGETRLILKRGDITVEQVDAVVNAASSRMRGGGGVDGAIHRAGGPEVLAECRRVVPDGSELPAGEAVLAGAGKLPARALIHTVGPIWSGGEAGEKRLLASCYERSLNLAARAGLRSLAFPAVSTGVYGYPFEEAAELSLSEVIDFCRSHPEELDEIRLVYHSEEDLRRAEEALVRLLAAD